MNLSPKETRVINLFRKKYVATLNSIQTEAQISRNTVLRALKKHGYFSSYNFNSKYFTIKDIPHFDKDGLWSYEKIHFSRYGTLNKTIKAIVENSPAGFTLRQLEEKLRTRVHNHVSLLCQKNQLDRFYVGRNTVYVSIEPELQAKQMDSRRSRIENSLTAADRIACCGKKLPEGLDAMTVLPILIQMIRTPKASVASMSITLQKQNLKIKAEQVRTVIDFYSLEKKKEN
jgi:hypothetical protein